MATKEFVAPSRGMSIGIPTTRKLVRVILVDGRPGNLLTRCEMVGKMNLPITVYQGLVKTTWRFDEFKNSPTGLVLDPCAQGCNIVFPFMTDEDCLDAQGKSMSLDEMRLIFQKYHPTLKVERKR